MKWKRSSVVMLGAVVFLSAAMLSPGMIMAHCDTLEGPVVQSARVALETKDVTPVLKWLRLGDEQNIRTAFSRTLAVRDKGADVQELADLYFFETLVRLHRAGEGAPYTGLKSADAVDPAVVLADQALESGNADKLTGALTGALADGIEARFQQVLHRAGSMPTTAWRPAGSLCTTMCSSPITLKGCTT